MARTWRRSVRNFNAAMRRANRRRRYNAALPATAPISKHLRAAQRVRRSGMAVRRIGNAGALRAARNRARGRSYVR